MFLKHSRLLAVGALSFSVSSVVCLTATEVMAAPKKAAAKPSEKEGPRLIAVGPVTGPMQFSVRQWLRGAIDNAPDKFAQVDDDKSKALAADADEKAMAGFAKKNKAKAIVVGEVKKTPKGYTLTVKVFGADGVEMDGVEFEGASAAKLKKSVESSLVTALEGVLGMGAAAPDAAAPGAVATDGGIAPEAVVLEEDESAVKKAAKEENADAEEAPIEEVAPVADEPKTGSSLTPLKVEVGGRARSRSFAYTDPLDGFYPELAGVELPAPADIGGLEAGARYPLVDYSLVYPGVFVGLELYPLAFGSDGVPAYFGVVANYQKDALSTTTAIGDDVLSTSSFSYFLGGKVRVPLGKHQAAAFGGIGEHRFDVGTENNDFVDVITTNAAGMSTTVNRISEVSVPSTDYRYIRLGLEGTVNVEPISITAGFGGRLVSATGELQNDNWFPGAKAQGWDAALSAALPIMTLAGGPVSLEAGVDYTRYAWTANSIPEDVAVARVAGGGVDNYVSGWLGVSFALPGSGGNVSVNAAAASDEATSSAAAKSAAEDKSDETSDTEAGTDASDSEDSEDEDEE